MVQLHLDSSFGGFKLSPLIGAPTMRVVDLSVFSSLSVLVSFRGDFVSVSIFCLVFSEDLELRLPEVLPRGSLLSEFALPTTVTVGRKSSNITEFSFSIAMFAARYARSCTMELQNSIVSVASSSVKLLALFPPCPSSVTVDSSVKRDGSSDT